MAVLIWSCNSPKSEEAIDSNHLEIKQMHTDYVNGWLEMDEEKVMGLLEENARIQPNRLKPIEGKSNIRMFWFPKDSSKTIINEYKTELISLEVMDTLAVSSHTSLLDWTYQKDTISFGMLQKGINTTVYRKQTDKTWKIWRSMWTDIYAERK
ncbi:YybH family protein [Poritiphilus flavus]|uniref:DUF4440 domain-containing protein n=1 Tax=Poritiphilus flavus TaxID=2697053 RepID=A0A6L9EG39_9FLAO|nr:hypothetical protein [Poritiphilus flavus]NAS13707.1 hypothetical protein [Poritiphilus flavus]